MFEDVNLDKSWFEMRSEIRRLISEVVWIPLRQDLKREVGPYGKVGHIHDYIGVNTVAIKKNKRVEGEKIDWSRNGFGHGVFAAGRRYKPADVYWGDEETDIGLHLVIAQSFDGLENRVWHLNQDVVLALGLIRERDNWLRPSEAYDLVARLHRDKNGRETLLDIKSDYLRDYLLARSLSLRVNTYRQRRAIFAERPSFGWNFSGNSETIFGGRFEGRAWPIYEGGFPYGHKKAVFHMARNDGDFGADVPVMDAESSENIVGDSWVVGEDGPQLWQVEGEYWRDEWLDPARRSVRVRGDKVPSDTRFMVDASGKRLSADELNNQDIGRWLWFNPNIIGSVLNYRGSSLVWHTRDTGTVEFAYGYGVHFGINSEDLVTVHAYDIACLPEWQRVIWQGFNVMPNGGVSRELLSSQMQATPATSQSPEKFLPKSMEILDILWNARWGMSLFREHASVSEIVPRVHRFRALEQGGLLSLAKDVVRLTLDRLNLETLNSISSPPKEGKRGTLKSLEAVLATVVSPAEAHKVMGPLFGVYELRLADAHLPSSTLSSNLGLAGVDQNSSALKQGLSLLNSVVTAHYAIIAIIDSTEGGSTQ